MKVCLAFLLLLGVASARNARQFGMCWGLECDFEVYGPEGCPEGFTCIPMNCGNACRETSTPSFIGRDIEPVDRRQNGCPPFDCTVSCGITIGEDGCPKCGCSRPQSTPTF